MCASCACENESVGCALGVCEEREECACVKVCEREVGDREPVRGEDIVTGSANREGGRGEKVNAGTAGVLCKSHSHYL